MARAATRKKAVKKAAAKKAPATTRRKRQRTIDIPTISRSVIRSSISDRPTSGGLVSRIEPVATAESLFNLGDVSYPFAIFTDDCDSPDWSNNLDSADSEDQAFQSAAEEAKRLIDGNYDDEVTVYVVQVIGKVTAKREDITTTVQRVGQGPA